MVKKEEKEAELADVLQEASKRKKIPEIVAGVPVAEKEKFPEGEQAKEEKLPPEKVEVKEN